MRTLIQSICAAACAAFIFTACEPVNTPNPTPDLDGDETVMKLQGTKIEQVYVGIGGQSLHTIDYTVSKILGGKGTVSEEVLSELEQDAHEYRPDTLDVLSVVSPTYMLDGNIEFDPLGHTCNRLEAIYKLVVGRPSLRLNLMKAIEEKCKIKIAGMFMPLGQTSIQYLQAVQLIAP